MQMKRKDKKYFELLVELFKATDCATMKSLPNRCKYFKCQNITTMKNCGHVMPEIWFFSTSLVLLH